MKINEVQRIGSVNPYIKSGDPRNDYGTGRREKRKDEVQISPEAKQLHGTQGFNAGDSVRHTSQRSLEELKQAVETGS